MTRISLSKIILSIFLLLIIFFGVQKNTQALYKPYLKIEADRVAFQQKVATYSPANQQKLTDLSSQIDEINRRRIDELNLQIAAQAAVLDEYQKRFPDKTTQIDKARYWLTYAHEAVAFQLIQVYIYNLSSENNIKSDATAIVNKFESDLSATRTKVANSQITITNLTHNE